MNNLYEKLEKITNMNFETWQKIEMIVDQILLGSLEKTTDWISVIDNIEYLKRIYFEEMKNTKERLAISNIDNWLKIDEDWLQGFRKKLDDKWLSVRIICKPQWVKFEPNWLKNREVKTLSSKYLLVSNIDILDWNKIIITKPWEANIWVYISDHHIHNIFKQLFYSLWNSNQYMIWVNSWDELATQKRIEIMHSWKNFGIDFVINPVLYKKIFSILETGKKKIVDFWCWLNTLGMQIIYWLPSKIEWLKHINGIESLRKNIVEFTWFEANEKFVEQSLKDSQELEADELTIIWKELIKNNTLPQKDNSIDLGVSRNFIVHLNYDDLEFHFAEVQRILSKWGKYIVSTLNPDYENVKYKQLTNNVLIDWDRYNHYHGKNGELGIRVQYYKSKENLEKVMKKYFNLVESQYCFPTNDLWKTSNPLYYDKNCPMGIIYTLQKS